MVEVQCFGCGATVTEIDGPVHTYMRAAPGCWSLYCSLLNRKFPGAVERTGPPQGLVNAYAAQHGTNTERRNRQSVALHLISLCAGLERGVSGEHRRGLIGRMAHRDYPVLQPSPTSFTITVRDVADAEETVILRVVHDWEQATWLAWSAHQDQVREWLDDELRTAYGR
ncbi:DUF5946 family protein [Ferrimicrobium sp.]|uniref:DUF5946 family protein n=1 Tax=Ferrimicrobium sp. TaxID=2926050 RepID=UPI002632E878|nr:DUF5946 family protein [Ferrimicrobium sp.]